MPTDPLESLSGSFLLYKVSLCLAAINLVDAAIVWRGPIFRVPLRLRPRHWHIAVHFMVGLFALSCVVWGSIAEDLGHKLVLWFAILFDVYVNCVISSSSFLAMALRHSRSRILDGNQGQK
jgi:hypothetical protein